VQQSNRKRVTVGIIRKETFVRNKSSGNWSEKMINNHVLFRIRVEVRLWEVKRMSRAESERESERERR
jgi:hypothetical protein